MKDIHSISNWAEPETKVVGVNAPGGAVTVLSGKVYLAQTVTDVIECLR